jgi:hypothetical protein
MIKRKVLLFILLSVLVFISLQLNAAEYKEMKAKEVDFSIDDIKAWKCICDLKGLNIFYMNSVYVLVSNNHGAKEDAEITLQFYDHVTGSNRKVVTKVKGLSAGERRWILVVKRPLLISRITGLSATVKPLFPGFVNDTKETNDTGEIYRCIVK